MKPRKLLWLCLLMVASLVVASLLQLYVVIPPVAMASPDTVTYYFNAYDAAEAWETSPADMTDNVLANYANTNNKNEVELLNVNNCSGTDLGTITKVELRAYGYSGGDDYINIRPVFAGVTDGSDYTWNPMPGSPAWSGYFDITNDTSAPASWNWTAVQNLDCDIQAIRLIGPDLVYVAKVEIRVTYTPVTVISFTVTDYNSDGVNFSSLSPGSVDQPADQNATVGAVTLTVANETNVNVGIYLNGTNFTKGGDTIPVTNVKYNSSNSTSGADTLTTSYVLWYNVTAFTENVTQCYYWISIPAGQAAGDYSSTFYYKAQET